MFHKINAGYSFPGGQYRENISNTDMFFILPLEFGVIVDIHRDKKTWNSMLKL